MKKYKVFKIFDINFHDICLNLLSDKLDRGAGLMTFPAAPALINIYKDKLYFEAIKNSDLVLFDSGYLCLLLKFFKDIHVKKLSGLKFLKFFFNTVKKNKKKIFLINPSIIDNEINKYYLKSIGIKSYKGYIAPKYSKNVKDKKLIKVINKVKPKYILINIGGGTQEKLGYYIKKKINFNSSIICTGAAIAFLTGRQAKIPNFIDKLYLGWFFRILFSPKLYFMRYYNSFKLIKMILSYDIKSYDKK
tara:strand:- start:349 stop:1089 length:741 start_codon:yes stop_codon:yes gene_type:complete